MEHLLASLARLKETWPPSPWEWDARLEAVASSFAIELEPEVRESARNAFPRGWTAKSIDTAPEPFRALAARTGLRSRQRVLGGDELTAPALFGLWWPWASGERITLRIGIMDATPAASARLRRAFDV
ncbi:MAG TPA: hypothetical protein VFQ65_21780 [Kofleriaceae bacterium]|nr:hypothetical protein [Kofleriaceae bacterium]